MKWLIIAIGFVILVWIISMLIQSADRRRRKAIVQKKIEEKKKAEEEGP